jgi:CBS domain-containing protein
MIAANVGCILIVGSKGHLRGILTDGDIKRQLEFFAAITDAVVSARPRAILMTADPICDPRRGTGR